jgi:hypothetical protein
MVCLGNMCVDTVHKGDNDDDDDDDDNNNNNNNSNKQITACAGVDPGSVGHDYVF